MSNDTPRNSLSMFRKSKMLELEKANADLKEKNVEYEKAISQLRQEIEIQKSQNSFESGQNSQSHPHNMHHLTQKQNEEISQNNHNQGYETNEDELEVETARFNGSQENLEQATNDNSNWTQVKNKKKRNRDSPNLSHSQARAKQNLTDSYWLARETSNRFEALSNAEETQTITEPIEQPCKPPPIFLDKVENIQPLFSLLNQHVEGQYDIKTISNNVIKIIPKSIECYKTIVTELDKKKTEFYTYKPKNERGFKIVMRGMHPSADTEVIKEELRNLGHDVTNIWNIWNKNKNIRYPLFEIELKTNSNNKNIYDIKSLMYCKISFEPPKPKKSPPQCTNCQQYGHTRTFCRRQPKCIKCAGDHLSKTCERKEWGNQVKCALCSGNHPANYKGCSIFKQLSKHIYPVGRNSRKRLENMNHEPRVVTNENTYASIARMNQGYSQDRPNENIQQTTSVPNSSVSEIPQMLTMLHQLMQQMTNLIVNITAKITQN